MDQRERNRLWRLAQDQLKTLRVIYGYTPAPYQRMEGHLARTLYEYQWENYSLSLREGPEAIDLFYVPIFLNHHIGLSFYYTHIPTRAAARPIFRNYSGSGRAFVTFTGTKGSFGRAVRPGEFLRGRGLRIPEVQGRGTFSYWNGYSENRANAKEELIWLIRKRENLLNNDRVLIYLEDPNPLYIQAYAFPNDDTSDSLEVKFRRWVAQFRPNALPREFAEPYLSINVRAAIFRWGREYGSTNGPRPPPNFLALANPTGPYRESEAQENQSARRGTTQRVSPTEELAVPAGTENAITMEAIEDGATLANFQGESGHGRYYLATTVESLRDRRGLKNPFTREPFTRENIQFYTARVPARTNEGQSGGRRARKGTRKGNHKGNRSTYRKTRR
jgi:hypothetical protein